MTDPLRLLQHDRPSLVGMVHLKPLPGSPRFGGSMPAVVEAAVTDAQSLSSGGVDAIMIENFGDVPFYPGRVPAETTAGLVAAVVAVRSVTDLPIGVNVLRNDGRTAVAIAACTGASFVRVNVLAGSRVADQGLLSSEAARVMRDRARLAPEVQVWADVDVKHSAALADRPLADEVGDLVDRSLADAVIVSGSGTGQPTSPEQVRAVRDASRGRPVVVGSGATLETLVELGADAYIVGTSLKIGGRVDQPVDAERVQRFVDVIRSIP
jgi:membrane complex biogenesis BtpA family protein